MAKNAVVIIGGNAANGNAGERDYARGILETAKRAGLKADAEVLLYVVPPHDTEKRARMEAFGGNARFMPRDNKEYDDFVVGYFAAKAMRDLEGMENVTLIGAGHSTLDSVLELQGKLKEAGVDVQASYITHMPDGAEHLRRMADGGPKVFMPEPASREILEAIDPIAGRTIDFVPMQAVPSTNRADIIEGLRKDFYNAPEQSGIRTLAVGSTPFAVAVVNAGFSVLNERHPYAVEEAQRDGRAFAQLLLARGVEQVVLLEGGPRNGADREQLHKQAVDHNAKVEKAFRPFTEVSIPRERHDPLAVFRKAVREEMKAHGVDVIIHEERYGTSYNAVNAALYVAAVSDNCKVVQTNSEGWGTMATAVQTINNTDKDLVMFDFAANHADKTNWRNLNTQLYHRWGVSMLSADAEGNLRVEEHPERRITPFRLENGADVVVRTLGFTNMPGSPTLRVTSEPTAPR
jgi:hypothetical protein